MLDTTLHTDNCRATTHSVQPARLDRPLACGVGKVQACVDGWADLGRGGQMGSDKSSRVAMSRIRNKMPVLDSEEGAIQYYRDLDE